MTPTELAPAFFLAVVVVLFTCRLVGRLLRAAGQPPVVGEMVAGVVLGPSVLGALLPDVEAGLFPTELRPILYVVGQIGLVAFMFRAGWEFRLDRVRGVARPAGVISLAGIVVPLLLGGALTWFADGRADVFPDDVPLAVSALFVGVALAITAFPMLARIITERGLQETRFGALSLGAGAVDDAVAWVLLAGVLGMATGDAGPVAIALGGSVLLLGALVLVLRSRGHAVRLAERLTPENLLLVVVAVLFVAAWYTDTIGLYAVFGAFSLGVVFPRSERLDRAVGALTPVGALFLPLFFTYSGLNTDFALLGSGSLLLFTAACVAVAILGKFGACWLAARAAGEPQSVALRVGALMNARGLMQLIALNVGLAAGIVTPALFSALVVVALVTTTMATPVLSLFDRLDRRRDRGNLTERATATPESV
ncbi:cation:proton antiporter [Saccharothrix longispora]|uniref:Kef-type K+ transport system membrane component KefB n=1 Tax=Saccharothrix longispora TaxID=33920 RepID=A0ABU1PQD4_9PSEU|nr:cation:proton antiporter [Saccharothrix longispora]MDR6592868.1 Kef-type K+ transport system membrane component KefB [Saccharothrix longispora]